ncbi:Thiol-disulfide oxidoreductase ResA [Planctomycetes bacterium CA13]|uniref:Thiol-disulfide oxidoreductase ResA n=2 Tax=Novipirellula herctigrandis TaxID=2527986 RepID=A0A5C5ZBA0_9BACT|nr:Thiol-disulfide oxidoreductase ResA [Planctomycetes bacterium CA13]
MTGKRANAQTASIENLRTEGAFGFPANLATTLCDSDDLRVQVCNDEQSLVVQAIVWKDSSDALGETSDGRAIGDRSSLLIDVDFDEKQTAELDRTYSLNPWPVRPGLQYTIPYKQGSSHILGDSKGHGSIRYVTVSDGKKVRVDSYVIPLAEIKAETGKPIGIAFMATSASPEFIVNSIDFTTDRQRYYAFNLPYKDFDVVTLVSGAESIDVSKVPSGRKDQKRAEKPKVKPLLKIGAVPGALTAEQWLNTDSAPTLKSLKGKVVLIDFWATWCVPCVAGIPHLNELYEKHKDEGLQIIGFTDQSRKGIEEFQKNVKMDYPVGVGSELGAEFGVKGLPHLFLIGRDGKLVWEGLPNDEAFEKTLADALDANVETPAETNHDKPSLDPGATFSLDFPKLGKTWRGESTKAGVYIPDDYISEKKFPLFVWFGGGAGTDDPKKAIAITGGSGFVCLAVPYRSDDDGESGGWQTPWSFYKTIFDKLESIVPNIDSQRRVCGGHSSGGAAIMYQIGNSEESFQDYFFAFMPGGAGWPMGGLATIKGRPMLALMGENDKRLPNFKKLEEEARAAEIDFQLLLFKDTGHKMPAEYHGEIREWMVKNVVTRDR